MAAMIAAAKERAEKAAKLKPPDPVYSKDELRAELNLLQESCLRGKLDFLKSKLALL
jgi:hypothetical protein